MVIMLKQLKWDERNVRHIARHRVSVDEVEEIFTRYHYVDVGHQKRRLVIGETNDGRILEVPIVGKGSGRYYPITAYDARDEKAEKYLRAKAKKEGGEQI